MRPVVLVMDDDQEMASALVDLLELHECVAVPVHHAAQALAVLDVLPVDVVVSDVMMPGLSGLDILAAVKLRSPDIQVVLITGYGSRDIAAAASEGGAFAYLEKPLDLDRLVHTVQAARQRAEQLARAGPSRETGATRRPAVQRRLAALLNADIEGYSRLMRADEAGTVGRLTACRRLIATLVTQYQGRVVDAVGDNLLAEFASAVDAVQCGVAIQGQLAAEDAGRAREDRIVLRIGINVGDVLVDGGRLYGNAINVTARLQSLAEGGGICISGVVHEFVKAKLALRFEPMGAHTFKNIDEPVSVYRVGVPAGRPKGPARTTALAPRLLGEGPLIVMN